MDPSPNESREGEPESGITLRRAAAVLLWFLAGFVAFVVAVWLATQLGLP